MQVGTSAPDTPYAAIGGGVAQNFQIAQSAHGFRILSSTLYRDKVRAVVREILCNAIDAHIAAGIADKPVDVALTDEQIVIRDYGLGIHDENMVDVFCTYFASTKIADEKQTGGFGLGCKAPFAVSDHFSVTSRHDGVMSSYAIAIGSEQTGGAPSLRKMVAVSTTEQGVTVAVPFENGAQDRSKFEIALRSVVHEGGMKVRLNGEPLPTIDYAACKQRGFAILYSQRNHERQVKVICGNVVYAVDADPTLDTLRHELQRKIIRGGMSIILMAEPGSIRPKPDREGLSYETITLETLKRLMENVTAVIDRDVEEMVTRLTVETLKKFGRWDLRGAQSRLRYDAYGNEEDVAHGTYEDFLRLIAKKVLGQRHDTSTPIAKVALGMFREGRGSLKRAINAIPLKRGHYYCALRADLEHMIARKVLRIAREVGAEDKIYSRHKSGDLFRKIYATYKSGRGDDVTEKEHGLGSHTMTICFTRTREEASARIVAGFAIVTGRELSEADKAKLKAKAEKLGFKVVEAVREDYQPVKRAKRVKPEEIAYVEAKIGNPGRGHAYHLPSAAAITKPAAYLTCGVGRRTKSFSSEPNGATVSFDCYLREGFTKNLLKVVPKTVVPTTKTELLRLREQKIPRFQDVVLAQAQERLKKPAEVEIAALAWLSFRRQFWRSTSHHVDALIEEAHPRVIEAVIGLKPIRNAEKSWEFWRLVAAMAQLTVTTCVLIEEDIAEAKKTTESIVALLEDAVKKATNPLVVFQNSKRTEADRDSLKTCIDIHKSVLTYAQSDVFRDPKRVDLALQLLKFERRRLSSVKATKENVDE